MSSERFRKLIDQATAALVSGKYSEALKVLDEAGDLEPDDPSVFSLRAIGFAQTGKAEAASESFRKAAKLEPSAQAYYNLAVHLYNIGEWNESFDNLRECLKLDTSHVEGRKMLEVFQGKGEDPQFSASGQPIDPTMLSRKRRYGFGRKHLFAVLAENQEPWVALGWMIVGLSLVSVLVIKIWSPLTLPAKPDMHDMLMGYKPIKSPAAFATIGFFVTMVLASMIWTSLDLIDRRGRALWMVPMMIFCFMTMPFIPQSLYMFAGRREKS